MNKQEKILSERLLYVINKMRFIQELKQYFGENEILSLDTILEEEKLFFVELDDILKKITFNKNGNDSPNNHIE